MKFAGVLLTYVPHAGKTIFEGKQENVEETAQLFKAEPDTNVETLSEEVKTNEKSSASGPPQNPLEMRPPKDPNGAGKRNGEVE